MFDCTISVENWGKNNEKSLVFKKSTKKLQSPQNAGIKKPHKT